MPPPAPARSRRLQPFLFLSMCADARIARRALTSGTNVVPAPPALLSPTLRSALPRSWSALDWRLKFDVANPRLVLASSARVWLPVTPLLVVSVPNSGRRLPEHRPIRQVHLLLLGIHHLPTR